MAWNKKTVRTSLGSGVIYHGPGGSFIEDKARRTGVLRQRGDDAPDRFVLFLHGKGLGRPFATLAAAQEAAEGRANPKAQARKLYRNPGWTPELYSAAQKYLQDQAAKEYATQVKQHVKAGRAKSTARYSVPEWHREMVDALGLDDPSTFLALKHRRMAYDVPLKRRNPPAEPYLGRHGLAHKPHPMLGLDPKQVRATKKHLKMLQDARKAGYKGSFTTDPKWLVEQAINRRGGYVDDPGGRRGSALPVGGKFPKKGSGDLEADLWRISRDVNTPRLRVYEQRLGSWKKELTKRLPHRFVKPDEDW